MAHFAYSAVVQRLQVAPDDPSVDLSAAVNALRAGGVVAFPTDTFYGLAVDPRSSEAVQRLFALKRRAADQAIPLIAADRNQVTQAGTLTETANRLAVRWWPGPLTVVIPASPELCAEVHRGTGRVAVRVPDDRIARSLARAAGHPITATSANRSGMPASMTADGVIEQLGESVDVLVDAGPSPGGLPSTIVDVTGPLPILIRAGAVPWERVLESLQ
jgi:L-threonylcarbamoyladenylate synthase